MRRGVFVVAVIAVPNFLVLHYMVLFGFSTASLIYLLSLWPFVDNSTTLFEILNEVSCFMLMYHLICFTDFVPDPDIRYNLGYSYVFFASGNILIHLLSILRSNFDKLI